MPTTTTSKPAATLQLETLLSQLRQRGIAVGTVEMQRLQAIFERSPQLSHRELRNLLSVVLAKDNRQREVLNRVFDRLVPFETDEVAEGFVSDNNQQANAPAEGSKQQSAANLAYEDDTEEEADKSLIQRLKTFDWRSVEPLTIFYAALALLATIILILSVVALEQGDDKKPSSSPTRIVEPPPPKPIQEVKAEPGEQPLNLVKTIDYWSAHVESTPVDPWPRLLPWLALLLGSGLAFSWLLHQALKSTRRQPLKPPNVKAGKGRFQVPKLSKQADYHLLSGKQRREMRWGISRYISEQPLSRLDIKASVESSAKAGLPEIRFLQASEEREVWLWQDQSSDNKDLVRLVEEISNSLQRGNIPVQRGYFRGMPATVRNAQKEILWSNRHEYPENAPLVVIFADAESLARQQQHDSTQSNSTLRQLSQWENLCFVDNSYQPGTLQRLLQANQITCLLPQEVPHWLAKQGQDVLAPADTCSLDSLRKWAMACALPTRILKEDEIRAVHDAIGLTCAWQFHALERYAAKTGAGFYFQAQRVALLNEMSDGITRDDESLKVLLDGAVSFWRQRNVDIDAALTATEINNVTANFGRAPRKWKHTLRQQTLKLDSALLQLWEKPTEAANALSDLHAEPKLSKKVREHLNLFTCADFESVHDDQASTQIQLPFSWHELEAETQRQLLDCGFGGVPDTKASLRWDKTTRLMLASFAGVALVSLGFSSFILMQSEMEPLTRLDSPEPVASERIPSQQKGFYLADTYKSIGLYKDAAKNRKAVKESHQLTITWAKKEAQAAQFDIDNDPKAQLWLLGEKAKPQRPVLSNEPRPDLSIAVIYGDPKDMTLRRLAAKLLDTGSADQVLLGSGDYLLKHHRNLVAQSALIKSTQWLYVGGKVLIDSDQRTGKSIAHWEKIPMALLDLLSQSDDMVELTALENSNLGVFLQSEKNADPDKVIELANNLKLIKLPRGSFQMGSNDGGSDEKPIHTVTIDYDLWMGQTEVTFEQYDAYVEDSKKEKPSDETWGRETQPVINVSWKDTQGYAEWLTSTNTKGLQCRLPSEAEWEYAARAGTQTKYSWGDDIGKNNANCDGCGSEWDNKQTAPVGSFPPNTWDLHDMHGNVDEWIQDTYQDNYEGAPDNGEAWVKGDGRRVLRGGSWGSSPDFLRSAFRGALTPDYRGYDIGFRVVCSLPSVR